MNTKKSSTHFFFSACCDFVLKDFESVSTTTSALLTGRTSPPPTQDYGTPADRFEMDTGQRVSGSAGQRGQRVSGSAGQRVSGSTGQRVSGSTGSPLDLEERQGHAVVIKPAADWRRASSTDRRESLF
ncbi:hypothetical protein CesoFtcFv8_006922 [Champsocephalus esox]|uniref:Uncharacterized protein n=1 Tax=Champsocephalus esox TaxID=159716 RepID=A0AAN8H4A8_9TELE|nr:hypothetical protein CesoFtcFv8_006922 [Champsocephalus esox]